MLASVSKLLKVTEEGDSSGISDDKHFAPSQRATIAVLGERDRNRQNYLDDDINRDMKKPLHQTSHSHSPNLQDMIKRPNKKLRSNFENILSE